MTSQESAHFRRDKVFPFISYLPSSGLSEKEKARTRLLVRSYAAQQRFERDRDIQNIWNKDENHKSDGSVQNARGSAIAPCPILSPPKSDFGVYRRPISYGNPHYSSDGEDPRKEVYDRSVIESLRRPSVMASDSIYELENIEHFGSGSLDPFDTYPLRNLPSGTLEESFNYSLSVLWPNLIPGYVKGVNPAIDSWSRLYIVDEISCFALSFGAICHKLSNRRLSCNFDGQLSPVEKRSLILLEMKSARIINKALQDPYQPITDTLILSALCMANNNSLNIKLHETKVSPFRSPLQHLQWLDVYGTKPFDLAHHRGLFELVQLRGGLQSIELPGLAAIISFSDILAASKTLSRPRLPFAPLQENIRPNLQEMLGFGNIEIELDIGQCSDIGFTQQLSEVFQAIKIYISTLEDFEKCKQSLRKETRLCLMADQRNLIQYVLLSLPSAEQISDFSPEGPLLYDACRISGLIFSIGVIFPLPYEAGALQKLTKILKLELQRIPRPCLQSPRAQGVLIWILTIGGIAAIDALERSWFVTQLKTMVEMSSLRDWSQLKRVLRRTLWLDSACDLAGRSLLAEI